jgi:serine/threonine protein kinase
VSNSEADSSLDKFPTLQSNEVGYAMHQLMKPPAAVYVSEPGLKPAGSEAPARQKSPVTPLERQPQSEELPKTRPFERPQNFQQRLPKTRQFEQPQNFQPSSQFEQSPPSPEGQQALLQLPPSLPGLPGLQAPQSPPSQSSWQRYRQEAPSQSQEETTAAPEQDQQGSWSKTGGAETTAPVVETSSTKDRINQEFEQSERISRAGDSTVGPSQNKQPTPQEIQEARDQIMNAYIGQTLDNQYEIISRIGQGGMSVVYQARHVVLKKKVAIKMMLPHLVTQPSSIQRFQQEAQAASNLVHTNVITIYNFGTTREGQPYLVMDYLEGTALSSVIQSDGSMPVSRAVPIFLQIANALAHAHNKLVIHRDLKPSNIILIEQGERKDVVQIVDFGIAKMLSQDGQAGLNLTQTGEVFGSPYYMSPEQCKGEKLDNRSDIYSMGCLMYEVLTGKPPLMGENTLEVLYKHISDVPAPMSTPERKIPPRLEAIVFRCLAKSPAERYQTMEELEQDLDVVQRSQQFSLLSILKSRWHLSRLKRLPQSKREKAAFISIVVAGTVILVAGCYPLWRFWTLADLDVVKQGMLLEEDRYPVTPKRDEANTLGSQIAVVEAEDYLRHKSVEKDPKHIYAALTHDAKNLEESGLYQDAAEVLKKALQLSRAVNYDASIPTVYAEIELANVYYTMGAFEDAFKLYSHVIDQLSMVEREPERIAAFSARLANCYWHLGQYGPAVRYYKVAISIWSRPFVLPMRDGTMKATIGASFIGTNQRALQLTGPDAFPFALSMTRLASIYQARLADPMTRESLSTAERAEYEKRFPELLFAALPIWRNDQTEKGRTNEAITECLLGRALTKGDVAHLKRPSSANLDAKRDAAQQKLDQDPEYLFANGCKNLLAKTDLQHPRHAQALLMYSHWLWANHRYAQSILAHFQACKEIQDIGLSAPSSSARS